MKRYRDWNPAQAYLLPPSPQDWLAEDHLVYFLLDVLDGLDLSAIENVLQAKDHRGTRPHPPQMMVGLLLYGYCVGIFSSRKLEKATYEDVAFRVLCAGNHPDHTRISEFRRIHLDALTGLFSQVLLLCSKAGLVKLGHVALDGTKIQANASKHKAMSYKRMLEDEAKLREQIAELLARAEQADQDEDSRYGKGKRGDGLPEELQRREMRLAAIERAKAELEAEAAQARAQLLRERAQAQRKQAHNADEPVERKRAATRAANAQAQADALDRSDDDEPPTAAGGGEQPLPHHRVASTPEGKPTDKAQRNFTDPDSRIMKRDGAYMQGYNGQALVDEEHQIIIASATTNQAPDQQHLPPLVEQGRDNCGRYPDAFLADAGYWDAKHVEFCEQRGIDPYIATGRLRRGEPPQTVRGRPPKNLSPKQRMHRKLRTKKGQQIYARRKVIPEPVFGQIRVGQGFQGFLLRGIDKVRAEWSLVCACHNLLKIFRAGALAPA